MFFSIIKAITRIFVLRESKKFLVFLFTAVLSILLPSELSRTKGRHFEMFLAKFDISIFTHGYESLWLNLNIVLFRNIRRDL